MRTKPVIIVVVLIVVAIAIAWALRERDAAPPPADTAPEVEAAMPSDVPVAKPIVEAAEIPDITPSPQGLYDDLDAAFERAGRKPELELPRAQTPDLAPPERTTDDDGEVEP